SVQGRRNVPHRLHERREVLGDGLPRRRPSKAELQDQPILAKRSQAARENGATSRLLGSRTFLLGTPRRSFFLTLRTFLRLAIRLFGRSKACGKFAALGSTVGEPRLERPELGRILWNDPELDAQLVVYILAAVRCGFTHLGGPLAFDRSFLDVCAKLRRSNEDVTAVLVTAQRS